MVRGIPILYYILVEFTLMHKCQTIVIHVYIVFFLHPDEWRLAILQVYRYRKVYASYMYDSGSSDFSVRTDYTVDPRLSELRLSESLIIRIEFHTQ